MHTPSRGNAVNGRVEEGEDAVRFEIAPLGHRTTHDRCGRCGEGELEEERGENRSHQRISHLRIDKKVAERHKGIGERSTAKGHSVAEEPVGESLYN